MWRYERAKPGHWYCYSPTGLLFLLKDSEKLNRKRRMKVVRLSHSVYRRFGYRVLGWRI